MDLNCSRRPALSGLSVGLLAKGRTCAKVPGGRVAAEGDSWMDPRDGDSGSIERWPTGRDAAVDGDTDTRLAEAGQNGHGDEIRGVGRRSYSTLCRSRLETERWLSEPQHPRRWMGVYGSSSGFGKDSNVSQHRRVGESQWPVGCALTPEGSSQPLGVRRFTAFKRCQGSG